LDGDVGAVNHPVDSFPVTSDERAKVRLVVFASGKDKPGKGHQAVQRQYFQCEIYTRLQFKLSRGQYRAQFERRGVAQFTNLRFAEAAIQIFGVERQSFGVVFVRQIHHIARMASIRTTQPTKSAPVCLFARICARGVHHPISFTQERHETTDGGESCTDRL
jgi:hypothetical protein